MRLRDQLLGPKDGRARQARLGERGQRLVGAREAGDPLADDLVERARVPAAQIAAGEARIAPELRPPHESEEPRPELGRAGDLKREIAPADLVHEQPGARVAVLRAAVQHRRKRDAVGGHQCLEHRNVEMRAAARAAAAPQRREDGVAGVGGGQHVGGLEVGGARRRLVALLEVHHSRDGVHDVGEGGTELPRPRLPEAGDRAVHDVGLDAADGLVVAAEPAHHAGHEVLDEDIDALGQLEHEVAASRIREIDADALLPGVHAREVRALIVPPRLDLVRAAAHLVALARTLHLDDARAEIGEQPRAVRAGEDAGEIEDDQAVERQISGGHRRSITIRAPTG